MSEIERPQTEGPRTMSAGLGPQAVMASLLLGFLAQGLLFLARQSEAAKRFGWITALGPWLALLLYAASSLLIAIGARREHVAEEESAASADVPLRPLDLAAPLSAILAAGAAITLFRGDTPRAPVWGLAALSLAAIVWSCARLHRQSSLCQERAHATVAAWEVIGMLLILLLAAAWRTHLLDIVPSGIFFDEARNGLDAIEILERNTHPLWSDSLSGRPTLHLHLLAATFRLLGARVFSMRLVSITFGLLAITALYLLARSLFGGRAALLAAFFLAVSRYHTHYSRLVFEAGMTPFLLILGIYCMWRALRQRRWLDYVLSAALISAGLYTYVSFRLLPLVVGGLVLYRLVGERCFLRRHLPGLLLFTAVSALLLIPLARFALDEPARFFSRYHEVALLNEVQQAGSIRPVVKNAVGYLTMFNYRGDENRVLNLPGEPGLSFVASVLFVLGVALSIARWRDARYALPLIWLLVALLPGALTHSIETPHSTRVLAALPAACLLAGLALHEIWCTLRGSVASAPTARWRTWGAAAAVGLALIVTAVVDYRAYFVRQRDNPHNYYGFEPGANRVGRLVAQWHDDYDIIVSPTYAYVYPEDSIVRFVAWNAREDGRGYQALDYVRDIPYREDTGRGIAYILEPGCRLLTSLLHQFYPQGVLEEHLDPFRGVLFLTFRVSAEDIHAARGLQGSFYLTDSDTTPAATRRDFQAELSWNSEAAPLALPYRAEWRGSLYIPAYAPYTFDAETSGEVELLLDGEVIPFGRETSLPKGMHDIQIIYRPAAGMDALQIFWRAPHLPRQVIPGNALCPVPASPSGLEGMYYRSLEWEGPPASVQLDPLIFPNHFMLEGIFSISWRGQLHITEGGTYRFGTESDDGSLLFIDDTLVVDNSGIHGAQYREGAINLEPGWHDIVIKYQQDGGGMALSVFWTPPGGQRVRLPESALRYPIGDWGQDVSLAPLPAPSEQAAVPFTPTGTPLQKPVALSLGDPVATWGKEGSGKGEFREPRGIAVGADGRIYVADTGNKRVQVFDSDGRYLAMWQKADQPLEVPWDIVINSRGEILVLDIGPCWIYRFDAAGRYLGKFAGPEARLYASHGMSIDRQGNIYVADTGGFRLVRFSADGVLAAEYGGKGSGPGQLLEPTDVAFASNGDMFVVDNSNQRIQRWGADGTYIGEWPIPVANAYNGPHLVAAGDDTLFVTVPERHQIWRYTAGGEVLEEYGGPDQFRVPTDLALSGGFLYVADTLRHRIHKLPILTP